MKYPTSETTKQELSAALKTLMSQKPLEKISIREITDLCGLRRETFYYHFADIYDLVKWMFEEEAIVLLRQHEGVQLWQEGLLQLFHYIQDNRAFCLCALRSIGHICESFFKQTSMALYKGPWNSCPGKWAVPRMSW